VTPSTSTLTFSWTPATLVFGAAVVLVTAVLSYLIWKRNGCSRSTALVECLRLLGVVLVAITLNQPEWKETFLPDEKPTIAVLWDQSNSMNTIDVLHQKNPAAPLRKRSDLVHDLLQADLWKNLEEKVDLVFEPFSSRQEVPSEGTNLSAALDKVSEQHPKLRGLVLFSDGDWNEGDPPARAATRLRMRNTPVFALAVGSETRLPDIEALSFEVPTFAITGKPVRLPFTLSSSLPQDRTVSVSMTTDEGDELAKEVTIPALGRVQDTFSWKPGAIGEVNLTLAVAPVEEERNTKNNQLSAPMSIRKEELKVLLIESYPRWEYRYLRNALERDPGVQVKCLLFHPDIKAKGGGQDYLNEFPDPDVLSGFDVIFLGDAGLIENQLTEKQCVELKQQVATQAAGLVFLPGFRGYQHTLEQSALGDLLPVILDQAQPRGWGSPSPGQFELTDAGLRSLLTRLADDDNENQDIWQSLPGFQWFAGVERAKPGTEVLATHSSESNRYGRIPLIVTKTFGTGKVLFMGTDGAWRWRKGVEDKYHYRFWGQVARWMAYQRNMASGETMRLFYSPDRPQSGDVLTLNANVLSIGGEPLKAATVMVQATAPSGKVESLQLQPGGEAQWGLFTGTMTPMEPGEYRITMTCVENGGALDSNITVQGSAREKTDQPARYDVMEEIAKITRGELIHKPNVKAIIEKISALPEPPPMERRLLIWAHPIWIGLIVLLFSLFWIGRKMIGTV